MHGYIKEIDTLTGTGLVEALPNFQVFRFLLSDMQERLEVGQNVEFDEAYQPVNIRAVGKSRANKYSGDPADNMPCHVTAYGPEDADIRIAVPFGGRMVVPEWTMALADLRSPLPVGYLAVKGQKIIEARNMLAQKALELKARYLFFLDDDTEPPANVIELLLQALEHSPYARVAGGLCGFRRLKSPAIAYTSEAPYFLDWKSGEIHEVVRTGTGCMLIDTSVFSSLSVPWFAGRETSREKFQLTGEDFYFCDKVTAAGFKIVAHGGVVCKHRDTQTRIAYTPVQKHLWDLGIDGNGAYGSED